jgi:hypothetical protein
MFPVKPAVAAEQRIKGAFKLVELAEEAARFVALQALSLDKCKQ